MLSEPIIGTAARLAGDTGPRALQVGDRVVVEARPLVRAEVLAVQPGIMHEIHDGVLVAGHEPTLRMGADGAELDTLITRNLYANNLVAFRRLIGQTFEMGPEGRLRITGVNRNGLVVRDAATGGPPASTPWGPEYLEAYFSDTYAWSMGIGSALEALQGAQLLVPHFTSEQLLSRVSRIDKGTLKFNWGGERTVIPDRRLVEQNREDFAKIVGMDAVVPDSRISARVHGLSEDLNIVLRTEDDQLISVHHSDVHRFFQVNPRLLEQFVGEYAVVRFDPPAVTSSAWRLRKQKGDWAQVERVSVPRDSGTTHPESRRWISKDHFEYMNSHSYRPSPDGVARLGVSIPPRDVARITISDGSQLPEITTLLTSGPGRAASANAWNAGVEVGNFMSRMRRAFDKAGVGDQWPVDRVWVRANAIEVGGISHALVGGHIPIIELAPVASVTDHIPRVTVRHEGAHVLLTGLGIRNTGAQSRAMNEGLSDALSILSDPALTRAADAWIHNSVDYLAGTGIITKLSEFSDDLEVHLAGGIIPSAIARMHMAGIEPDDLLDILIRTITDEFHAPDGLLKFKNTADIMLHHAQKEWGAADHRTTILVRELRAGELVPDRAQILNRELHRADLAEDIQTRAVDEGLADAIAILKGRGLTRAAGAWSHDTVDYVAGTGTLTKLSDFWNQEEPVGASGIITSAIARMHMAGMEPDDLLDILARTFTDEQFHLSGVNDGARRLSFENTAKLMMLNARQAWRVRDERMEILVRELFDGELI